MPTFVGRSVGLWKKCQKLSIQAPFYLTGGGMSGWMYWCGSQSAKNLNREKTGKTDLT